MTTINENKVQAIIWTRGELSLLDQRRLPSRTEYLAIDSAQEAAAAIRAMVVRGAPAIGITAAYAIVLAGRRRLAEHGSAWREAFEQDLELLSAARPTAVNLRWAVARMRQVADQNEDGTVLAALTATAESIHAEDVASNHRMGELGAACIGAANGVLTHCNAGSLATGGYGTALGVIRRAYADGRIREVYAGETRPWLQGARLTAWELVQEGIPVTLIPDSAAAHLMRERRFDWVIVVADRVAANGDAANKIGTYSLAVNARHHGVKFMVVAPTSTIDLETACGNDVPIEERGGDEVTTCAGTQIAPSAARACNPVFDVTPAELIDVLVTEQGVIRRPRRESIEALFTGLGGR
jgi:methylthioribose-1-phosphate isomerase